MNKSMAKSINVAIIHKMHHDVTLHDVMADTKRLFISSKKYGASNYAVC